jgi:hypothetical protein
MAQVYSLEVQANDGLLVFDSSLTSGGVGSYRQNLVRLGNRLFGICNGSQTGAYTLTCKYNKTYATGTITLASVLNNDTVTIAGQVLTAKTANPGANQFLVGVSNTADAAALVAAINLSTNATFGYATATSALAVVTVSGGDAGLIGNLVTLASSNGGRLAVSGAALTGGAETAAVVAL